MYEKIRKLAKERGISIPNLEKACGFSNGTISKWEESSPRLENIAKVADFFGLTVDYFVQK